MAKKEPNNSSNGANSASSTVKELLLAAIERNDNTNKTGRFIATFKDDVAKNKIDSWHS